jgi:hypothetical protein
MYCKATARQAMIIHALLQEISVPTGSRNVVINSDFAWLKAEEQLAVSLLWL